MTSTAKIILTVIIIVLVGCGLWYAFSRTPQSSQITSGTTPGTSSLTGTVVSSTSTSDTDWESGMKVITSADNMSTINLSLHERFVIALASTTDWSISFDPTGSITRVANSTTAGSIQGVYEADQVGTSTMSATGGPRCNPGEMCPMYRILDRTTFVIQ